MAARTTPATPVNDTPITVPFWNLNRDNVQNLQDLVPEPTVVGYPLVSTATGSGTSTATFKKVTQAGIDSVGLDADTLDGVQGSGYSLAGHSHGAGATPGEVTMWNASNASIPSSKVELTVMRNRFPLGANGTYAFGFTGGSQTHTHTYNPHSHNYSGGTGGGDNIDTENVQSDGDEERSYAEQHSHSYSGTTSDGGGGTTAGPSDGLPPCYGISFTLAV